MGLGILNNKMRWKHFQKCFGTQKGGFEKVEFWHISIFTWRKPQLKQPKPKMRPKKNTKMIYL